MRSIFADTFYWIALLKPRDQAHDLAVSVGKGLVVVGIVTTDEVLTEFLNSPRRALRPQSPSRAGMKTRSMLAWICPAVVSIATALRALSARARAGLCSSRACRISARI